MGTRSRPRIGAVVAMIGGFVGIGASASRAHPPEEHQGPGGYPPPAHAPGAPSYPPPAYQPPGYQPPSYSPPAYRPPAYPPSSYPPPVYNPPAYDAPVDRTPGRPYRSARPADPYHPGARSDDAPRPADPYGGSPRYAAPPPAASPAPRIATPHQALPPATAAPTAPVDHKAVGSTAHRLTGQIESFLQAFAPSARAVPGGDRILAEARRMKEAADRFHHSAHAGADRGRLAAEFQALQASRQRLANHIAEAADGRRRGPNLDLVRQMFATTDQIRGLLR